MINWISQPSQLSVLHSKGVLYIVIVTFHSVSHCEGQPWRCPGLDAAGTAAQGGSDLRVFSWNFGTLQPSDGTLPTARAAQQYGRTGAFVARYREDEACAFVVFLAGRRGFGIRLAKTPSFLEVRDKEVL